MICFGKQIGTLSRCNAGTETRKFVYSSRSHSISFTMDENARQTKLVIASQP